MLESNSILFRYLYLVKRKEASRSLNFKFRYNDDVLSLNNSLDRTYQIEHEIKDNRDTVQAASYLDLQLEIDSEWRLSTKLYDKEMISIFPL